MSTPQPPEPPDPSKPDAAAAPPPGSATPGAAMPDAATPAGSPAAKKEDQPSTWQPGLYLKLTLLLIAIAWSIAFVVQNTRQIRIDFVFATAKVHLIWEILLLLAIGLLGGVLLSQLYRHRRRTNLAKKAGEAGDARANVGRRDEAVRKPR